MTDRSFLRLQNIVDQIAADLAGTDGRFRKCDLFDAVLDRLTDDDLDQHVKAAAAHKAAESLVTGYGERRNPRRRKTGTLFHPQDIVKLGNGTWVRMDRATDSDLLAWKRLCRRNLTRVTRATDEVEDYVDGRLDAYRLHRGFVYLIDLERSAFGWTEADSLGDPLQS